jgi:LCP family protein required for cell wall assembly
MKANFESSMSVVDAPPQTPRPTGSPILSPGSDRGGPQGPPPPSGRRSRREKVILAFGWGLTALLIAGAVIISEGLSRFDNLTTSFESLFEAPVGQPTNWLLVGSDSRDGISPDDPNAGYFRDGDVPVGKRTDTMILARVDADAGTIDMLPIPRDLWVDIHGADRSGRVNSAFASDDGEERLIQTIQENLGVEIHRYAEINFVGFQQIVDEMGGVEMWFDTPMRDPASGLFINSPGCINLAGFEALALARSRNIEFQRSDGRWTTDASGDLGRISRQQYFLKRVVDAASSLSLTDIGTLKGLTDAVGDNLTISEMEIDELVELARAFKDFNGDQITSHSLPVVPFRTESRAAVLALQPAEANQVLAVFRGEDPQPIPPQEASVELAILNGSRIPGQAKSVEGLLGSHGFEISEIDNGPTSEITVLTYGPGFEAAAAHVARYLEVAPVFEPDGEHEGLTLLTGVDFDGIRSDPLSADTFDVPAAPGVAEETAAPEAEPIGVLPESGDRGACS